MSATLDFSAVARAALAQCPGILQQWFPAGRLRGHEYEVGNLRGDRGDSLKINVRTGAWCEFNGQGAKGGDLVSLYAAMHGIGQGDAFRDLSKALGTDDFRPAPGTVHVPAAAPKTDAWQPIMPVPADAPPPPAAHPKYGAPAHVAEVRDASGALLHLICRFNPPASGERKQVCPLTYGTKDGRTGWHWKGPDAPRPLYGLDRLAAHPDRPVLIVEGEPKRDAAERLIGDRAVVVSWPNGADGIGKADWTPLRGRDVAVWPDADAPGRNAAAAVVNVLRAVAGSVFIVDPPEDAPKGWDLADAEREGWTGERVWARIIGSRPAPRQAAPAPSDDGLDYAGPTQREPEAERDTAPFIALGHNRGRYFFYTRRGRQVLELSPRDLRSDACLLQLAPLRWWEGAYPGKESFNTKAAADALLEACYGRGIYDPDTMRGRGAWLDDGRAVLHLGNYLAVDGDLVQLDRLRSRHVYEQAQRLDVDATVEPLSTKEAARLLDLCMMPAWEDQEAHGRLLAGWLVVASVCGAMVWRPHLWVTSEPGGGKSWVLDNLVRPILGNLALRVQSKTSEAGIRAELGVDARPVVFDEAETQNQRDRERMQQILDLARQASSEDGGVIIKGTADGGTRRYRIRSCFCFASVNLGLTQAADESRTVVLTLSPPSDPVERTDRFDRMKAAHAEILTPEFPARLLARTMSLLPVIRANAEVFATAIARSGASRRTGDTLGVLLAGAWSLRSNRTATAAEADAFIAGHAWVQDSAKAAQAEPEWRRAITHLVQAEARFTSANGRTEQTTLGVLIAAAAGMTDDGYVARDADRYLRERGMRVKDGSLFILNGATLLAEAFAETPWATGWLATLARAPGAKRSVPHRFTPMTMGKALQLPIEAVTGETEA